MSFPEVKSFPIKLLCCLFNYCQSFPNFLNHQAVIIITFSFLKYRTSSTLECYLLSIRMCSIWLGVFPSVEVQVCLWMFRCGNIMLLTTRCFMWQRLLLYHHYHYYLDLDAHSQLSVLYYSVVCTKSFSQLKISISFSLEKNYSPLLLLCPLCPT